MRKQTKQNRTPAASSSLRCAAMKMRIKPRRAQEAGDSSGACTTTNTAAFSFAKSRDNTATKNSQITQPLRASHSCMIASMRTCIYASCSAIHTCVHARMYALYHGACFMHATHMLRPVVHVKTAMHGACLVRIAMQAKCGYYD